MIYIYFIWIQLDQAAPKTLNDDDKDKDDDDERCYYDNNAAGEMGEHASDGSAKLNFVLSASFSSEYFKRPSAECKL